MFDSLMAWLSDLLAAFFSWLAALMPDWLGQGYSSISALLGPAAQYFAYLFALDVVAPAILSAYVIKFLIRRVPVVG